ncbi:conserved hypothetical protein [Culex quinquefasciatus]|uniref:Uncharacterized protein n=1 Tax=Culex quinquefasciatus TaxID=7176 RepID=B0WUF7_CULQU|nr:conserved hypothetical protein [Culex quinquefasciatus]|eukprot:XP_001870947.1 conserved hypothetical protein [Culex quinquefasciatus]
MAVNLQSLSVVMNNYYTAFDANRVLVNASLNDLGYFVNVTVSTLNKTYGASQPSFASMVSTASYFNQSLGYGESYVNSLITSDLSTLTWNLQAAIDNIFQSFQMALYSMSSYDQSYVQDNCVAKNLTQMSQIPNSLSKLGPCLQQEVNTANVITPTIISTIQLFKKDLTAYINLLQICQPTSSSCFDQFFTMASNDFGQLWNALHMVQQYVSSAQQDAYARNKICSEMVKSDIQDAISNLQSAVSSCANPAPVTVGRA